MTVPTVETDLGKILERMEQNLAEFRKEANQNLAEFRKEANQKLDSLAKEATDLRIGQARLEERMTSVEREAQGIKDNIKDIRDSQGKQIWALIGILGTAVVGTVIRFVITAMPGGNP
jgi:DNA repair ATPase RecN